MADDVVMRGVDDFCHREYPRLYGTLRLYCNDVWLADNPRGFRHTIPTSLGDAGAPVVTNYWNAYGVIVQTIDGPYGKTIERVLQLLDEAHFDLELVTAYDEAVRGSS